MTTDDNNTKNTQLTSNVSDSKDTNYSVELPNFLSDHIDLSQDLDGYSKIVERKRVFS